MPRQKFPNTLCVQYYNHGKIFMKKTGKVLKYYSFVEAMKHVLGGGKMLLL